MDNRKIWMGWNGDGMRRGKVGRYKEIGMKGKKGER